MVAQFLRVELTDEPLPSPSATPSQAYESPTPPPPLAKPLTAPAVPPLVAVAGPAPHIAFALPVEGPVRVVDAAEASFARQAVVEATNAAPTGVAVASPPVQTLSYGQGEGRQPAPEYPRQAVRERQEGTVVVRLSVGEEGRVVAAEAVTPSPWPLLNQSAVRTVRERWRFRPGPMRVYDVPIRFELTKS